MWNLWCIYAIPIDELVNGSALLHLTGLFSNILLKNKYFYLLNVVATNVKKIPKQDKWATNNNREGQFFFFFWKTEKANSLQYITSFFVSFSNQFNCMCEQTRQQTEQQKRGEKKRVIFRPHIHISRHLFAIKLTIEQYVVLKASSKHFMDTICHIHPTW